MNIFINRCDDKRILASRELINVISDVISQIDVSLNCTEDALSTDREYVMQMFEASSVHRNIVVITVIALAWGCGDVTFISTIAEKHLH